MEKINKANIDENKIDEIIRNSINLSKDIKFRTIEESKFWKMYIQNEVVTNRRKRAIKNVMPVIMEKYNGEYDQNLLVHHFSLYCSNSGVDSRTLGSRDRITHWSTAAAIWVLDELKANGKISELDIEKYYSQDSKPLIKDSVHSEKLVTAMTNLIKKQMMNNKLLFSDINAEYPKSNVSNEAYKDFLKVIELINPESVKKADFNLESKIYEIIDAFLTAALLEYDGKASCKCAICGSHCVARYLKKAKIHKAMEVLPIYINGLMVCSATEVLKKPTKYLNKFTKTFKIENPYETCFAVFHMIASGNDLVWLYSPLFPILKQCWLEFPWNTNCFIDDIEQKKGYHDYLLMSDDMCGDESERISKLVFQKTNMLLPRRDISIGKNIGEENLVLLAYAFTDRENEHKSEIEEYQKKLSDKNVSENVKHMRKIHNSKEIESLKNRVSFLEKTLQHSRHVNNELKKTISDNQKMHETEHEELIRLRENVYTMNTFAESKKYKNNISCSENVNIPKKRIVCVGGNSTWKTKMSKQLPSVIFCNPDAKTNSAMLEQADEIWIQMNGIRKTETNPIKKYAKSHKIPCRFFTQQSVQKCIEEMAC